MTMGGGYVALSYLFSLFMFMNYTNAIFFWLFMEVNLMFFVLVMFQSKDSAIKKDSLDILLYYFIIQSSSSILFLSNYSFLDWGSIFNSDVMFISSLVFKIGLFPLFFWIFILSPNLNFSSLVLLLTLQKIPLFMGLFYGSSFWLWLIFFFSALFGSLILFFSNTFLSMIISSSISYTLLFFYFFSFSLGLFSSLFLLYSFFILTCVFCLYKSSSSLLSSVVDYVLLSCFFLGLPPLGMFFYKFFFSEILYLFVGPVELFLLWLLGVGSLLGYLKFFFNFFFIPDSLYTTFKFWFTKMSPSLVAFQIFLLFLV